MSKIVVGLLSGRINYGAPHHLIIDYLRKHVQRCRAEIARVDKRRQGRFQAVFIAPEYMFTSPNDIQRKPMSGAQKNAVEQQLMALSNSFPGVLILAGTVFYRELVVGAVRAQMVGGLVSNELEIKKAYVEAFRPAAGLSLPQIAKVNILQDVQNGTVNYAAMSPEDKKRLNKFFMRVAGWDQAGIHVPGLVELARGYNDAVRSRVVQNRAYNRAYAFLDGERVGVYDKHTDFQETAGAAPEDLAFVPSTAAQSPEIDGLRFGFEICFDHGQGVLRDSGRSNLHFHVVMSDWVDTKKTHMVMGRGGYFMHASTNSAQTCVWSRASNGRVSKVDLSPPAASGTLSFCEIATPT